MPFISGMWFYTFSTTVFKTVVKNVLNTYFTTVFKTVVKNVLDRQTLCFTVANFRLVLFLVKGIAKLQRERFGNGFGERPGARTKAATITI